METLFNVLVGITILFFIILFLKQLLPKKSKEKLCVICISISLTWIILLTLYFLGRFDNVVLIALLIGQSIVGLFYFADSISSEELKIFKLPFILTLISIGYFVLEQEKFLKSLILLIVLWIIFGLIYIYRKNSQIKSFVDKLVECCKRW